MKILGLDTSMSACSVAVIDTDIAIPLASSFAPMERGQAEALAPMVQQVMRESGLRFSDIDRIAVTIGPGTFTGVRIGLAMARGLGLALNIPVVGIDTLSAIAANESASEVPLLVVADARNGEVYAAMFDSARRIMRGPLAMASSRAATESPSSTIVMGSAARMVIAASTRNDLVLSANGELPDAARFARLAVEVHITGEMPSPLYLRAPDAKPQSVPLRKATTLVFHHASMESASLLASMHGETFEKAWSAQSFCELLAMPGASATIVTEHGETAGFVLTRIAADEAEIITICTSPFAQRRGIAKELLTYQLTELANSGVRNLFIEVAEHNAAARQLYKSLGFSESGLRKGYYRHPGGDVEDAILMRRAIAP